jgi:hypothetical protein
MLIEEDMQRLLDRLAKGDLIKVAIEGSDVIVRFIDDSKVYLRASVYEGSNYIPSSVRQSLSYKMPLSNPSIRTFLTIDEQNFQINLNYLGQLSYLSSFEMKELLEEFSWVAEKWRLYLDEHDKNDLVYVRVR